MIEKPYICNIDSYTYFQWGFGRSKMLEMKVRRDYILYRFSCFGVNKKDDFQNIKSMSDFQNVKNIAEKYHGKLCWDEFLLEAKHGILKEKK